MVVEKQEWRVEVGEFIVQEGFQAVKISMLTVLIIHTVGLAGPLR